MWSEGRLAAGPAEIACVMRLSGVRSGAALDLCCGPGRHSTALADAGFDVTGVDRSLFLLDYARTRAGDRKIDFVHCDARSFVREEAFDLAINMFSSFGYFECNREDEILLRNVSRSLKPGGALVMELDGAESVAAIKGRTSWQDLADGKVAIMTGAPSQDRKHLGIRWMLVEGEQAKHAGFTLNLYTAPELVAMLKRAGFGSVEIFGSLEGTPYDHTAVRLVAVARKR